MNTADKHATTGSTLRSASPLTLFLLCVPLIFIGKTLLRDRQIANRQELGLRLKTAAQLGDLAAIKSLLESGAEVNFKGDKTPIAMTPLKAALMNGRWTCADYLLSKGARTDLDEPCMPKGNLLLRTCSGVPGDGQLTWARRLIGEGEDVNGVDDYGATPLHYAARGGSVELVELLLSHGANVNARDSSGATPLLYAAWWGQAKTPRVLLDRGADPAIRGGRDHVTPLEAFSRLPARRGTPDVEVLRKLLLQREPARR